ncbi:MAG: Ni/Fe-hydrogenase, b-type cytochrome subunit [Desulfurivibrionaceae bacterium]
MALEKKYAWSVLLRIYHWVMAVSTVFLVVTGFYIHDPWTNTTLVENSSFTMANMRYIHFLAAQFFACALLIRIYLLFFGNKVERILNFAPLSISNLKRLRHILYYYGYFSDHYEHPLGHNVLAGIFYCLTFIFGIVVTVSGFYLLYPETQFLKSIGIIIFGSPQYARFIHYISMWYFLIFILVHIYLVIWNSIRHPEGLVSSIIDGYKFKAEGEGK